MTAQAKPTEPERADDAPMQEPYVRQVEDHSLPAHEVLSDQHDAERADQTTTRLFVP
jgi:hypothetical protein